MLKFSSSVKRRDRKLTRQDSRYYDGSSAAKAEQIQQHRRTIAIDTDGGNYFEESSSGDAAAMIKRRPTWTNPGQRYSVAVESTPTSNAPLLFKAFLNGGIYMFFFLISFQLI